MRKAAPTSPRQLTIATFFSRAYFAPQWESVLYSVISTELVAHRNVIVSQFARRDGPVSVKPVLVNSESLFPATESRWRDS